MAASRAQSSVPCKSEYSTSVLVAAGATDDNDFEDYDWETLL